MSYIESTADHNFEMGEYITHIYAYYMGVKSQGVAVPTQTVEKKAPEISNVWVKDLGAGGYTVVYTVTDDYQLEKVVFPTWTNFENQDDLI